jgi:hypothetical protein
MFDHRKTPVSLVTWTGIDTQTRHHDTPLEHNSPSPSTRAAPLLYPFALCLIPWKKFPWWTEIVSFATAEAEPAFVPWLPLYSTLGGLDLGWETCLSVSLGRVSPISSVGHDRYSRSDPLGMS